MEFVMAAKQYNILNDHWGLSLLFKLYTVGLANICHLNFIFHLE